MSTRKRKLNSTDRKSTRHSGSKNPRIAASEPVIKTEASSSTNENKERSNTRTNNMDSTLRKSEWSNDIQASTETLQHTDSTLKNLSNVIEVSFRNMRVKLAKSQTIHFRLPKFSGNSLDWSYFKKAYDLSTELCGFTNQENVSRLLEALEGDAREYVYKKLPVMNNADDVIELLEYKFGNRITIARKLLNQLEELPSLKLGNISITHFASKLRYLINELKSMPFYLYNPELSQKIGDKLPDALKYSFNYYNHKQEDSMKSSLEKLSDFMTKQAESATKSGIFNLECPCESAMEKNQICFSISADVCDGLHVKESVHRNENSDNRRCLLCGNKDHRLDRCPGFRGASLSGRKSLVDKLNVCLNCLRRGHYRKYCRNITRCHTCNGLHHHLLHRYTKMDPNNDCSD